MAVCDTKVLFICLIFFHWNFWVLKFCLSLGLRLSGGFPLFLVFFRLQIFCLIHAYFRLCFPFPLFKCQPTCSRKINLHSSFLLLLTNNVCRFVLTSNDRFLCWVYTLFILINLDLNQASAADFVFLVLPAAVINIIIPAHNQ